MENEKTLGKISAKLIRKFYDENRPIFRIKHAQRILKKVIMLLQIY